MREPVRDRERLEHIQTAILRIQDNTKGMPMDNLSSNVLVYYGIVKNEQVNRYLAEVNWEEWEKNEVVIKETAVHKSLIQTAQRMKKDGLPVNQISRYTGLSVEEIEIL